MANDAITNAIHPKMAILRCRALQRPARAAMFLLPCIAPPRVLICMGRGSIAAAGVSVRLAGVLWGGYPHPPVRGFGNALRDWPGVTRGRSWCRRGTGRAAAAP